MRRIIVKEARPGMTAARSLAHPAIPGTRLVCAGEVLTAAHLARLHEEGLYDLWVNDPGLDYLDDLCASQPTVAQQRLASALRGSLLRLACDAHRGMLRRYDVVMEDLVRSLVKAATVVPCLAALTEDEGLLAHGSDVAVLSMVLGLTLESYLVEQRRRLRWRHARDVLNLGLGALYHDVGELMLPADQRESRVATTGHRPAGEEWKQHTEEGYAIVRGRLDPSAAAVVLHHHQRYDGSGFAGMAHGPGEGARALGGSAIHVFARIVAVADLFCVLQDDGGVPQPMVKVLTHMRRQEVRESLDPMVFEALTALIPPFAPGTVVTLSDRRAALVCGYEAQWPCRPEVQIIRPLDDPQEACGRTVRIRLAQCPELSIACVDGTEVEEYLSDEPQARGVAAA